MQSLSNSISTRDNFPDFSVGLSGIEKHGAVQMKGEKGNGPQRPIGLEGEQGDTLADILTHDFF